MPKAITSLTGFIRRIELLQSRVSGDLFFRGHSDNKYQLMPSIFRNSGLIEHEKNMMYSIISESPKDFETDEYSFDRLVRAQHFGIPTRLLDVTINPLIALYFACDDISKRGQVIVFEVQKDSSKFFLSDTISCKSNLFNLKSEEKADILKAIVTAHKATFSSPDDIKLRSSKKKDALKYSEFVRLFNTDPVVRRLVQFIKEEKPYFENKIDPVDLISIESATPKKNNARIAAQSGAFLVFGLYKQFTENSATNIDVIKIDISEDKKLNIRKALDAIGIHEGLVYPELDRAASRIKKKYMSL